MMPGDKDEQGKSTVSYNVSISPKIICEIYAHCLPPTDERKLQCVLGDRTK